MGIGLNKQYQDLLKAAHRRGLRVRRDDSLKKTEYRAMHPRAAKELGLKCPKNTITYQLSCRRPKSRRVLDLRHEIVEWDEMSKGKRYKAAHRIANKRQATVGVV